MDPTPPADLVLVEDDERLGELLAWFLERLGHRVRRARSFEEVRALCRQRLPDLLISDLRVGDTCATLELPRLAEAGLQPPTVVVSGFLDGSLAAAVEGLPGVLSTLRKPFEMEDLAAAVAAALPRAPDAAGDFPGAPA